MRRFVAGLAVGGLLIGAGCGDDASGASPEEIQEFCDGFNEINEQFSNANLVADPDALQEALEMLRDLDPPEDIAEEYADVLDGFQALSEIDITDQRAVERVQEELPAAEEAFSTVGEFVEDEC
jgi:protein subunit release factor A